MTDKMMQAIDEASAAIDTLRLAAIKAADDKFGETIALSELRKHPRDEFFSGVVLVKRRECPFANRKYATFRIYLYTENSGCKGVSFEHGVYDLSFDAGNRDFVHRVG